MALPDFKTLRKASMKLAAVINALTEVKVALDAISTEVHNEVHNNCYPSCERVLMKGYRHHCHRSLS